MSEAHNEDHGHPKPTTIFVNGKQKTVEKGKLSYQQVVDLAFENPPTGENVLITITYERGHSDKPQGSLTPGESVEVVEGMRFDVTATDKS